MLEAEYHPFLEVQRACSDCVHSVYKSAFQVVQSRPEEVGVPHFPSPDPRESKETVSRRDETDKESDGVGEGNCLPPRVHCRVHQLPLVSVGCCESLLLVSVAIGSSVSGMSFKSLINQMIPNLTEP